MHDIFLSYSTHDRVRLMPFVRALEQQGWSVFWDHRSVPVGKDWHDVIGDAIHECRCVVVAWSKHSVDSKWVREEALEGRERNALFPILLDGTSQPFGFRIIQSADFSHWNGKTDHPEFVKLVDEIRKLLGGKIPPPPPPPKSRVGWWLAGLVAMSAGGGYVYNQHPKPVEPVSMPVVEPAKPTVPAPPPALPVKVEPPPSTLVQPPEPELPSAKPNLISGRYLNNGDGTITDTKTKLVWKRCAEGQSGDDCSGGKAATYTWDDAMAKFGKGEWRLPTKDELKSLVYCNNGTATPLPDHESCGKDGTYQRPTIDQKAFPNTGEFSVYWSSSSVAGGGSNAWIVHFDNGYDDWDGKDGYSQVRLVRSGQ